MIVGMVRVGVPHLNRRIVVTDGVDYVNTSVTTDG
jgi:hypothetical protein